MAVESIVIQHEGVDAATEQEPAGGLRARHVGHTEPEPTAPRRLVGDQPLIEPRRIALPDPPVEIAPRTLQLRRVVEPVDGARVAPAHNVPSQPDQVAAARSESSFSISGLTPIQAPHAAHHVDELLHDDPSPPTEKAHDRERVRVEPDLADDVGPVVVARSAEPVERVVTRTVDRFAASPALRPSRPTVGERLATHDFRIRPLDPVQESPSERGQEQLPFESDQNPWASLRTPTDDPSEPVTATLDVPGLPSDLLFAPRSDGDGEPQSLVWDARSVMKPPEPDVESAGAEPIPDPPDVVSLPGLSRPPTTPALEGFAVRPQRRRRALQVGIPRPKAQGEPSPAMELRPLGPSRDMWVDDDDGDSTPRPDDARDEPLSEQQGPTAPAPTDAAAVTAARSGDSEQLADELYDQIRGRLRQELLIDRERSLLLTDLR